MHLALRYVLVHLALRRVHLALGCVPVHLALRCVQLFFFFRFQIQIKLDFRVVPRCSNGSSFGPHRKLTVFAFSCIITLDVRCGCCRADMRPRCGHLPVCLQGFRRASVAATRRQQLPTLLPSVVLARNRAP